MTNTETRPKRSRADYFNRAALLPTQIHLRVSAETKQQLQTLAARTNRTESEVIRDLIRREHAAE